MKPLKVGVMIDKVEYVGDYKLKIYFNNGHINTFDYYTLVKSGHPESAPYLDVTKFKKFKIDKYRTLIYWGDDAMYLELKDIYSKKYVRFPYQIRTPLSKIPPHVRKLLKK